jgi:hypothetical protein
VDGTEEVTIVSRDIALDCTRFFVGCDGRRLIGEEPINQLDGALYDMLLQHTYVSGDTHRTDNYPYYSEGEITSEDASVRISKHGVNIVQGGISSVDTIGRTVLVGADAGIKAIDAGGKIIHDITDGKILDDEQYMGHEIFRGGVDASLTSVSNTFTDSNTSRSGYSTLENFDLTSYLPEGNLNIKGICAGVRIDMYLHAWKGDASIVQGKVYAGHMYNSVPSDQDVILHLFDRQGTSDANTNTWRQIVEVLARMPVVWYNGKPYIVWRTYYNFSSMTSSSQNYYVNVTIYLRGWYV